MGMGGSGRRRTDHILPCITFAFMKGKSPAIHMAHSIGAFYGLSGMAIEVQGKQIAFVGDKKLTQQHNLSDRRH